jgi:hypothetical protein
MLQNKKIYGALMKPKHVIPEDEFLTNSYSKSPRKDGNVFSSLPLYRVIFSTVFIHVLKIYLFLKPRQSQNADLKLILLSNPYRINKELSYLSFNRVTLFLAL